MKPILLGGHEPEARKKIAKALIDRGYTVVCVATGAEVLTQLSAETNPISLLLLDLALPAGKDQPFLERTRMLRPELPVIVLCDVTSKRHAFAALKSFAVDLLTKPVSEGDLLDAVEQALARPNEPPSAQPDPPVFGAAGLLAPAAAWSQRVERLLAKIGGSDAPLLLRGETGVGKEVLARKFHQHSSRAQRPFLKLNCAALPSELIESELFGYERGAFTGAYKTTLGKFEMARGGTILLDEIGDMDVKLQAKLLQVLQDNEFIRIGGRETTHVDVRIMAATHCNLEQAISAGKFREDLFYRLNIIDIHIPPLRERRDEILPLAEFLIRRHSQPGALQPQITTPLQRALLQHDWPGNVRELENTIRKFLVLPDADWLAEDLRNRSTAKAIAATNKPGEIWNGRAFPRGSNSGRVENSAQVLPIDGAAPYQRKVESAVPDLSDLPSVSARNTGMDRQAVSSLARFEMARNAAEIEAIRSALEATRWNRKRAAMLLDIDYKALLYKMKKLGIEDGELPEIPRRSHGS